MMSRILIVEDDQNKLRKISNVLKTIIDLEYIENVIDARSAKMRLKEQYYDAVIIDIAIPNKIDEEVKSDGGLNLIDELLAREIYKMPTHILAVTGYSEIYDKLAGQFADKLIPFLYCDNTSDKWEKQLYNHIQRVIKARHYARLTSNNYESYLAIICALESPELHAVLRNGWEWQCIRIPNDATIYYKAIVVNDGVSKTCYAAAAPRKGMPAAAVLATKMITNLMPKYIAMAGITSGYAGKTRYGDVIAADPVWDWGSGKIVNTEGNIIFEPEPHQLDLEVYIRNQLRLMAGDRVSLSLISSEWTGEKPDHELIVHVGPLASGAAVLADKETHRRVLQQHRGILGIEMETYAVFCAAQESPMPRPTVFSLKSVVDFADAEKNDKYQKYGAYTSAQVLKLFVEKYL